MNIANFTKLFIVASVLTQTQFVYAVPVFGQKIMIAGPNRLAVEAGIEIARAGGNVVDAAIATELVLAVTTPYFGSLGGGGFAMVKMNGLVDSLDFREVAPLQTAADFYKNKSKDASQDGGTAVAVPGVPAGLKTLHARFGKLPWARLFKPAIRLATQGFEVTGEWSTRTDESTDRFNEGGKRVFLNGLGKVPGPGDVLRQPALAKVLVEMSATGTHSFYEGSVARDIVDSVKKAGGVLSIDDMKKYKTRWIHPLQTDAYGYHFNLMGPPSSGGVVIASALKLSELKKLESQLPQSSAELHLIGEILKASFRDQTLLSDPDFHSNPIAQVLDLKFLKTIADQIRPDKCATFKPFTDDEFKESHETTHFSVMDKDGNSVAFTVTLNGEYGSGVVSDRFGIALNNEMDDFTTRPGVPNQFDLIQGQANSVEPGKRPLSSMSPSIVEKDGHTILSVGSPGGPRIISAVFQVMYRALISGYDMDAAIQTVRVHHQFNPDVLYVDPERLSPDVIDELKKLGHKVEISHVAKVYGVKWNTTRKLLEGAYDSRGEGFASGF